MIEKDSQARLTCGSCLDFDKPKKVIDVFFEKPYDGSTIFIIHRCPLCEKLSRAKYYLVAEGPVASENGFKVTIEKDKKPDFC